MVELQPYCSFKDVCKLSIKIEKQKKVMKISATKTYTEGTSFSKGSFSYTKPETSFKDKGKEKTIDHHKDKPKITRTALNAMDMDTSKPIVLSKR